MTVNTHPQNLSRRELLARFASLGILSVTPARLLRAADPVKFRTDPFTLGVASGYPTAATVHDARCAHRSTLHRDVLRRQLRRG